MVLIYLLWRYSCQDVPQHLIFTTPIQVLFSIGYFLIFIVSILSERNYLIFVLLFCFLDWYIWQPVGGDSGDDQEAHENHHQHVHRQPGRGRHRHVSWWVDSVTRNCQIFYHFNYIKIEFRTVAYFWNSFPVKGTII